MAARRKQINGVRGPGIDRATKAQERTRAGRAPKLRERRPGVFSAVGGRSSRGGKSY